MKFTDLSKEVLHLLSRVEEKPKAFVQVMQWMQDDKLDKPQYTFAFYPKTEAGKQFTDQISRMHLQRHWDSAETMLTDIRAVLTVLIGEEDSDELHV